MKVQRKHIERLKRAGYTGYIVNPYEFTDKTSAHYFRVLIRRLVNIKKGSVL